MNEDKAYKHRKAYNIAVMALIFAVLAFTVWVSTEPITYTNSTYYNNTTGGGVSFNGSAVDLMSSLLHNGTFNGTFNGTYGTHDDLKVNKSGDNMTGLLEVKSLDVWQGNVNITNNDSLLTVMKLRNTNANYSVLFRQNFLGALSLIANWGLNDAPEDVTKPSWLIRALPGPDYFSIARAPVGSTVGANFSDVIRFTANDAIIYKTVTISPLAGSGDRFACIYPNGTLFAKATACDT